MAELNTRRRFLRSAVAAVGLLGGCGGLTEDPTTNTVAPQLRGTPSGTTVPDRGTEGQTPLTSDLKPLSEAWTSPTAPGLVAQLRIIDGALVAVVRREDGRTEVSRRRTEDGTVRWKQTLPGTVVNPQPLVFGGDTALVRTEVDDSTAGSETITALDAASGTVRWTLPRRGARSIIEAGEDFAYLGGLDEAGRRRVRAVGLTDGIQRWEVRTPELWTMTLGEQRPFIVDGQTLRAFDSAGQQLWEATTEATVQPTVTAGLGRVLFGGPEGKTLVGYDAATGSPRWRYSIWPDGLDEMAIISTRVFVGGTNLARLTLAGEEVWRITDRSLLLGSYLDQTPLYVDRRTVLVALAPESGDILWRFDPPSGETIGTLAAVESGIFVDAPETPPSEPWFLDRATGHPRGFYRSRGPIYASATAGRRLFVGKRGEVAAVDAPDQTNASPIDSP